MDIFGVAVLVFLVTDPFGNIAIYLAALKNVAPERRMRVALRELLLALALWVWDSWRGSKPSSPDGAQPAALNWKDARLDLDYVVSETGRDLGQAGNQVPLTQRLADAQLRPSFQKADQLIRAFVNQDPAARARVEKDNSSRGLAPVHPLLAGSGAPDAALVQRLLTRLRRRRRGRGEPGMLRPRRTDRA